MLLHVTINCLQRVVVALKYSWWEVEFTVVLPVGATGVGVDLLNKEARDKVGLTRKSYDAFRRRAVAAHVMLVAAPHAIWAYRLARRCTYWKTAALPPD